MIRDIEGNDEDEEVVANGLEGDPSVVAEQADVNDVEEGEVEDQTFHEIAQTEADTGNLVDVGTWAAKFPSSTDRAVGSRPGSPSPAASASEYRYRRAATGYVRDT